MHVTNDVTHAQWRQHCHDLVHALVPFMCVLYDLRVFGVSFGFIGAS